MKRARHFFFLPLLFLAAGSIFFARAEAQGETSANSPKAPRPFYIIGHGANTLAKAKDYLDAGANGLEVDVNLLGGPSNALCIGHGPHLGTGAAGKDSVPLAEFLNGLHELARDNRNFCLVYFDCKTLAATPEHGATLLAAIRKYLTGDGGEHLDLLTLISVGKLNEKAMFANIAGRLGPREALMVDGYSDPAAVSAFFTGANVTNQAFSDGIVPYNPFMSQFAVYGAVRKACRLRDERHQIRFVGTWSVNNPWFMKRYIRMGVDGIVADRRFAWYNFCWANLGHGLHSLTRLVRDEGNDLGIRPANRADNPFAIRGPADFDKPTQPTPLPGALTFKNAANGSSAAANANDAATDFPARKNLPSGN